MLVVAVFLVKGKRYVLLVDEHAVGGGEVVVVAACHIASGREEDVGNGRAAKGKGGVQRSVALGVGKVDLSVGTVLDEGLGDALVVAKVKRSVA